MKQEKARAVKAVAATKGESSRINRAWVRRPFSGVPISHASLNSIARGVKSARAGEIHTKDDERSTHCSSHGTATDNLEGKEHARNQQDTADGGEQAHRDVGNARLKVIFANFLKVKVAIKASQPAGQCNKHLGQWWMYVHEEFALDVFRCEAAKARESEW